jgi:hypothetical protein
VKRRPTTAAASHKERSTRARAERGIPRVLERAVNQRLEVRLALAHSSVPATLVDKDDFIQFLLQ